MHLTYSLMLTWLHFIHTLKNVEFKNGVYKEISTEKDFVNLKESSSNTESKLNIKIMCGTSLKILIIALNYFYSNQDVIA